MERFPLGWLKGSSLLVSPNNVMLLILSLIIPDYLHRLLSKVLTDFLNARDHTSQGILNCELVSLEIKDGLDKMW